MLDTIKHSYACSILKEKGIKIFRNGERILNQEYPFSYPKITTSLKIGYNYLSDFTEQKITKIKDYEYLRNLGWKISSRQVKSEAFFLQRRAYYLSQADSGDDDYGKFPINHHTLVDFQNQIIKLIGENVSLAGDSGWIPLRPKRGKYNVQKKANPFQLEKIMSIARDNIEEKLPKSFRQEKNEMMPIPEAVGGITENGEICCIPRILQSSKVEESPKILISGESGMGKTLTKLNLEGQYIDKYDYLVFNYNDVKSDTQAGCMAWGKDHHFYKELLMFNEPTKPIPYVYLHPIKKGLADENILYKGEVGFEVSFPFKDFLFDANLMKYNPQWGVSKASRKYIRNLTEDNHGNERIDGLLYKNNLDEVEELINNSISKEFATLIPSIFNLIKDVWNRGILDKTSGIKSKWVAKIGDKEYCYPPWDICLLCGISPSFITEDIRDEDWSPIWLKYVLQDVFAFAKTKEYRELQGKNILLDGDEMADILREKQTRDIIDRVYREGRSLYVGGINVVQYCKDVPDEILTNVTHHFAFNTKSPSDLEYLKKTYTKLTKTQLNEIGRLKKFQCMAFGDFILYDMNGNRYSNEGEPVKIIRIKPPNAQNYGGYKLGG